MKKLKKQTIGLTKTGLALGIGATTVGKVSGNTSGFAAVGGFLGPIGVTIGAGATLRQVRKLKPKKRRKK